MMEQDMVKGPGATLNLTSILHRTTLRTVSRAKTFVAKLIFLDKL